MGVGKVFKRIGGVAKAALGIARRIPTPAAPYLGLAADAIGLVESVVGGGNGALKKELARNLILAGIRTYEALQGRDIVDEKKLVESLGPTIDALVDIANQLELWDRLLPPVPKEN